MLSLKDKPLTQVREIDAGAELLLNLGRTTGTIKPYVQKAELGVLKTNLDTTFFEKFVKFCSADNRFAFSEFESLLFRAKFSTEVSIKISEEEREQVFNELSANILALVNNTETTDVNITQEWREDSEQNRTEER